MLDCRCFLCYNPYRSSPVLGESACSELQGGTEGASAS